MHRISRNVSVRIKRTGQWSKAEHLSPLRDGRFTTFVTSEAVDIRLSDAEKNAGIAFETIPTLFLTAVQKYQERTALAAALPGNNQWSYWTYLEYYDACWNFAKACVKLGLGRFKAVCILGFNSPQWFFANLGAIMAGGVSCGIYTTNKAEACHYVIDKTSADVVVVDDDQQLNKILEIWDRLPELKAVVLCNGQPPANSTRVYSWEAFIESGSDVEDTVVRLRIEEQRANQCCQVIFTSGTAGSPKGVLLSHDNITSTANRLVTWMKSRNETLLSYLPLSHIAAQMCDLWTSIVAGNTVYFARSDVLKGSLAQTLKSVKPTVLFAVPRVWEKMHHKIRLADDDGNAIRKRLIQLCQNIGYKAVARLSDGETSKPAGHAIAERLTFNRVRSSLGLEKCWLNVSSAAPLPEETQRYLWCHNVPVVQVYGLSESTGPHVASLSECGGFKFQSVGKALPGLQVKLDEETNEICLWGRNIMMGYLGMPEATAVAIDEAGWLHTGDVGRFDADGFLYVTGRIKDIIITAGGENIPPLLIENQIRRALPVLSNCLLLGDGRRFLSVLLTLPCLSDEETGLPVDKLTERALAFCRDCDSSSNTLEPIVCGKDALVINAIETGLRKVNSQATSRAQQIQKWCVLPADVSIKGGEIGPTMKIRRDFVLKKYKDVVEAIYDEVNDVTASRSLAIHNLR